MAEPGGWRPEPTLPEVAIAGRSNVGKSSLINRLLHRTKSPIARVSTTPGRTREVNFFRINDAFVLADLPGYGYAKASKALRAAWRPLIEGYLASSPVLRGVVLLVDVRHPPTGDDVAMREYLGELGAPTLVVGTKADKLSPRGVADAEAALARALDVPEDQVVLTSARSGRGRDALAEAVTQLVAGPPWR